MKIDKKKFAIAIILIALMAVVGIQSMAVFGTNTGVYWLEKTSYTANVDEQISVTGKMWVEEGGDYSISVQYPNYDTVYNLATKSFGTITSAGYWQFTIPVTVTQGGEYAVVGNRDNGILGDTRFTVSIPTGDAGELPTGEEIPEQPSDRCEGTTKVTYYLSGNTWVPNYIPNSVDCGYVAPPATASLFIDASPDGVLTIDGVVRGNTPMTVSGLSIGSHVISIQEDGYKELTETVTVSAGSNAESYYLEQITTEEPDADETEPPTDDGTDEGILITVLLVMMLVVIVLGGTYVYVKR